VIAVWFRERRRDRVFADKHRTSSDRERALADYRAAYAESDRLGAVALGAKFRMLRLLDDPGLRELADAAFRQIDDLRAAADKAEVRGTGRKVRITHVNVRGGRLSVVGLTRRLFRPPVPPRYERVACESILVVDVAHRSTPGRMRSVLGGEVAVLIC
jgi:hypothetical protein